MAKCQYKEGSKHNKVGMKYNTKEYPVSIKDFINNVVLHLKECARLSTL